MNYLQEIPIELFNLIAEYFKPDELLGLYTAYPDQCTKIMHKHFFINIYNQGNLKYIPRLLDINEHLPTMLNNLNNDYQLILKADDIASKLSDKKRYNTISFQLTYSQTKKYVYPGLIGVYNEVKIRNYIERVYIGKGDDYTCDIIVDTIQGHRLLSFACQAAIILEDEYLYILIINLLYDNQESVNINIGAEILDSDSTW